MQVREREQHSMNRHGETERDASRVGQMQSYLAAWRETASLHVLSAAAGVISICGSQGNFLDLYNEIFFVKSKYFTGLRLFD